MIEAESNSPVAADHPPDLEGPGKSLSFSGKTCYGVRSFFILMVTLGILLPRVVLGQVSLADALECAEVDFSTTSPALVYGTPNMNPADGDDGVVIGAAGVLGGALTGPGLLSWSGDSLIRFNLICYLDGLRVSADSQSLYVPPGAHEVRWVSRPGITSRLYSVSYGASTATTPGAVMNGGGLEWALSPIATAASHEGGVVALLISQPATVPGFYGMSVPVQGPGVMTLRLLIPGDSAPVFRLNGVVKSLGLIMAYTAWQTIQIPLPPGPQVLEISAPAGDPGQTAGAVYFLTQAASWRVQTTVPLAEALDAPELVFTIGGSAAWAGVAEAGEDKARVSQVPPGGSAWLETEVTGPGLLSYRSFPGTAFVLDGAAESRTPYWLDLSYVQTREIPAGVHRARWMFSVESSYPDYAGQMAEMDDVRWSPYQAQPLSAWAPGQGFSLTASDHQWSQVAGPDLDGGGSLHPLASSSGPVWVEGVFSGPAMLVFSTYLSDGGMVTVDGATRSLNLTSSGATGDWGRGHVAIPEGSHTVRWISSVYTPFFYLDGLRLLPSTGSLSEAAELPPGASIGGYGKRTWLPVTDSTLPDGDALMCEGIQQSWSVDSAPLNVPITGPVRVSFRVKGNPLPKLTVDGYPESMLNPDFTTLWTTEPEGWRKATLDLLPGPHVLSIHPEGSSPLSLDGMELTEPVQVWQPGEVIQIPGAVLTTNPANPFVGISLPGGSAPVSLYGSCQPGGLEGWLEMRVEGPGVARFQFKEHYFSRGLAWPSQFRLSVDGTVLPAPENSGTSLRDLELSTPNAYAVCLPEGSHTLRWTIHSKADESAGTYELTGFSFASGPALWTPPAEACGAFLCSERVPLQLRQEGGQTILRLGSAGSTPFTNNHEPVGLLTWSSPAPGQLKFRWRRIPDAIPWPPTTAWAAFTLGKEFEPSGVGNDWSSTRALGGQSEWQTAEMTMPFGATHASWRLPRTIPGIELAGFSFTSFEAIPLSEAAGIEGAVFSTDPAYPWRGFRDAAGVKFLIRPHLPDDSGATPAGWLSASINRPGVIGWGGVRTMFFSDMGEALLDGNMCYLPFVVPNGPHTVTWPGSNWSIFAAERREITFQPVPATYAAWAPTLNGQPVPVFMLLPDSDFDGDGQVNAMEFAFRSDPFAPNPPPTPALHHEGGSIIISLPEFRPLAEGVRMVFETSSDMLSWGETNAEMMPLSTPGQTRYRLLLSANRERLFVRARVKLVAEVP